MCNNLIALISICSVRVCVCVCVPKVSPVCTSNKLPLYQSTKSASHTPVGELMLGGNLGRFVSSLKSL